MQIFLFILCVWVYVGGCGCGWVGWRACVCESVWVDVCESVCLHFDCVCDCVCLITHQNVTYIFDGLFLLPFVILYLQQLE